MKRRLLFLLLTTGGFHMVTAQTFLSNADGTYSRFYYSPYGSTVIYPDGSHAVMYDLDSTQSVIIYADFSFSRIFYNGATTTVINSDFSASVIRNEAPVSFREPDTAAFYGAVPDRVKNSTDTGYILLSDDVVLKPDPREAEYILLNDLVDTTTMHSRSLNQKQHRSGLQESQTKTAAIILADPIYIPEKQKLQQPAADQPPGAASPAIQAVQ